MTKICTKCGVEQALEHFSLARGNADGLRSHCRDCASDAESNRKYRNNSPRYYPDGTDLSYTDITHERERELFTAAKAGDETAREFLIKNHLLYTLNQGRRWSHGKLPEDEVASAANAALMHAIDRFDPSRPNRFTSYLQWFVRRWMVDLWRSKNIVDQPKFGEDGSNAVSFDVSNCHTVEGNRSNTPKHFARPMFDDTGKMEGGLSFVPRDVPNLFTDHPVEELDHAEFMLRLLEESKDGLTEQEAEVIRRHFAETPESLDAIGKEWGLTRARISKIKLNALAKLKKKLKSKMDNAGVTR